MNQATDADIAQSDSDGIPTAIFHGFGDACINPGMGNFGKMIEKGTGGKTKCIEVGAPSLGEVLNNFETVAEKSCKEVAENDLFKGEFNVVGLSQGGLLARYIVEECDMPGKVRNFASYGGPHMGVDAIPHCFHGVICNAINFVAKKLVYLPIVQNHLSPAGYFRDVNNFDGYVKSSVFLPKLNNEENQHSDFATLRSNRWGDLNGALMVMFSEDTMIYPKETAWFQQLDKKGNVLPLNGTDFYNKDFIGLKALNEAGKAKFSEVKGDHLQFTKEDIENVLIPFLKQ